MKVFYTTTEIEPGVTRIDACIAKSPDADDVLFSATGSDGDDAKRSLVALAKEFGEKLVEVAQARADGTALAVCELTT